MGLDMDGMEQGIVQSKDRGLRVVDLALLAEDPRARSTRRRTEELGQIRLRPEYASAGASWSTRGVLGAVGGILDRPAGCQGERDNILDSRSIVV